jgi:hypothetical protein
MWYTYIHHKERKKGNDMHFLIACLLALIASILIAIAFKSIWLFVGLLFTFALLIYLFGLVSGLLQDCTQNVIHTIKITKNNH